MLIDFNDKSKIYDETFDPIFFRFDIEDLKLKKILGNKYEKETLIETPLKSKKKTYNNIFSS